MFCKILNRNQISKKFTDTSQIFIFFFFLFIHSFITFCIFQPLFWGSRVPTDNQDSKITSVFSTSWIAEQVSTLLFEIMRINWIMPLTDLSLAWESQEIAEKILGKYSKRRRSNVAIIIVRKVFISSFFFYCLLLNHSFQTNPNSITNCFKLFSLLQLYNYIAPASLF